MLSPRAQQLCSVFLVACVLLYAAPVHAALESAGLLDRATQHFQQSLAKWDIIMTYAAMRLFWLVATMALCWELGNLALRGASMEVALAFLVRFVFILGLWLYILSHASTFGSLIIDSLRQLGAQASGLEKDLMPSKILDLGFSILGKTLTFVLWTGGSAPIVATAALVIALAILLMFAHTAINMFLLVVSQWFLLYGGIFFLGFGVAPWGSVEAKNYLRLALSIGAQLMAMAAVVGLGESFILAQFAALSGDTKLAELVVILLVAIAMCRLANDVPKMFAAFTPAGYAPQGVGYATMFGAMASAGAALAASTAMMKGAAANVVGAYKAASAATAAARAMQAMPTPTPRAQTGVSTPAGGSISAAPTPGGGGSASRADTQARSPLGMMLASSGIGNSTSTNGSPSRSSTTAGHDKPGAATAKKPDGQSRGRGEEGARADAQHGDRGRTPQQSHRTTSGNPAGANAANTSTEAQPDTSTANQSSPPEAAPERAETAEALGDGQDNPAADREAKETAAADSAQAETGLNHDQTHSSTGEASDAAATANRADSSAARGASDLEAAANAASSSGAGADAATAPSSPAGGAETGAASGQVDQGAHASATGAAPAQNAPASTGPSADTSAGPAGAGTSAATAPAGSMGSAVGADAATRPTSDTGASAASSPGSAESSASASATPATGAGSAPNDAAPASSTAQPTAAPASPSDAGSGIGQRGSTAIAPNSGGAFVAAAKILGELALEHQLGHVRRAKRDFMAQADRSTGGQIAQAIRAKYGLNPPSSAETKDDSNSTLPQRAATSAGNESESVAKPHHNSDPKHPADWVTGDEPMTEKQWQFLQDRLGDEADPSMTKAEAAMLIDELIHGVADE